MFVYTMKQRKAFSDQDCLDSSYHQVNTFRTSLQEVGKLYIPRVHTWYGVQAQGEVESSVGFGAWFTMLAIGPDYRTCLYEPLKKLYTKIYTVGLVIIMRVLNVNGEFFLRSQKTKMQNKLIQLLNL